MYPVSHMFAWLLIVMRATGLFIVVPVFSYRSFPVIARLALAVILAWMVMPLLKSYPAIPPTGFEAILWVAKELVIGMMMGLAVRLIFFTLDFASQIVTMEIGLMPSPEFDPSGANQNNPLGSIFFYSGVVVFLSGFQYTMLYAFVRSFTLVPLGAIPADMSMMGLIVRHTQRIFELGTLMAAPIIAVNFLVNLVFSLLGRLVPKMNVFILSFSVRLLAGFLMLVLSLGLIFHYVVGDFNNMPELMLRFIPFHV